MAAKEEKKKWYPCAECGEKQVAWSGGLCLTCMDKRIEKALANLPKKK